VREKEENDRASVTSLVIKSARHRSESRSRAKRCVFRVEARLVVIRW
jgi:hypothetical protein